MCALLRASLAVSSLRLHFSRGGVTACLDVPVTAVPAGRGLASQRAVGFDEELLAALLQVTAHAPHASPIKRSSHYQHTH